MYKLFPEDAVDKHPVTPGEVLPARELYADMLAEHRRFDLALPEYQTVLKHAPNRLNALLGAAMCAEKTGDRQMAQTLQNTIATQTMHGNREMMLK